MTLCGGGEVPEVVCVGQQLCLRAEGVNPFGESYWTVLEFAHFVGSATGSTVTIQIDAPGPIIVGVHQGQHHGAAELQAFKVKITEIKDLYNSDGTYQQGYTGDGRVYSNRRYDPNDPARTIWTANTQYVDIKAEIEGQGDPPAGARVVWEFTDVDDPSNNPPTHAQAGQVLDPNDSDQIDNDGDGQADNNDGKDNTGTRDAPAWWEQIEQYALTIEGEGGVSAKTTIIDRVSKVRFHVMDDGGDNFKIKARIKLDENQPPCDTNAADTGVMTVWHLIDLETVKMPSGADLPYSQLKAHFEKAFVAWDVKEPRDVPDQNPMGQSEGAAYAAVQAYVSAPPSGQFEHAGRGGWFFMASAGNYGPAGSSQTLVNYTEHGLSTVLLGEGTGGPPDNEPIWIGGVVQLPVALPAGAEVASIQIFNEDGSASVFFGAEAHPQNPQNRVRVFSPNYHPQEDNPNSNDFMGLPDHGFAVGSQIRAKVYSPGALYTSGISPAVVIGENWYFQGRTIVFLGGGLGTMVHELTHGLGMAHQCGNKDYADVHKCVMHYTHLWLQDQTGALIPWSAGNGGNDLCAPHIRYIRRANLEHDQTPPGWRILGW